jgi:hypothetical protein
MPTKRFRNALAETVSGDATVDETGALTATKFGGSHLLAFDYWGGASQAAADYKLVSAKGGFLTQNPDTHAFFELEVNGSSGPAGTIWAASDDNWTEWMGIGGVSASGRLKIEGSRAFEFPDQPYVATFKIFHEGTNTIAAQADSTAVDVATMRADHNALLAKLRAAGLMAP